MSNRRVFLSNTRQEGDVIVADAEGMADEEFLTEVYQPHGISSNPKGGGESVLLEINGGTNNHIALSNGSNRQAKEGETVFYHGIGESDAVITMTSDTIKAKIGSFYFNIENGVISTNMVIESTAAINAKYVRATDDVIANLTSLRYHIHPTPAGPSGVPTI